MGFDRPTALGAGWRPGSVPLANGPPDSLRPWLDEPGSLTRRLRALAGEAFGVELQHQDWQRPWPSEAVRLGASTRRFAWVREVQLCRGRIPLIAARSVIPATSLRGPLRRLRRLGRQPLGHVLFGRYPVTRGVIDIAAVQPASPLGRRLARGLAAPAWARRSVFRVAGRPLLVTEVFLPELIHALSTGERS
jgi:chorismate--pyruvate lyase